MQRPTSLRVERPRQSLRELAQNAIRAAIMDFRFVPGQRLTERTLCAELGVSRSVVREVLRTLEAEGLVEVSAQRGPVVVPLRPGDAEQIYELRSLLESAAAQACAETAGAEAVARLGAKVDLLRRNLGSEDPRDSLRAAAEFYRLMFEIAGKRIAWTLVRGLNVRINALRAITISRPGRRAAAAQEIGELYEAVAAGDGPLAAERSAGHVARAASIAQEVLRETGGDEDALVALLQSLAPPPPPAGETSAEDGPDDRSGG